MYGVEWVGDDVGFIVDIFLCIDLYVVVNMCDCVVWIVIVMGVGCIFVMVICNCVVLVLMFDDSNLGLIVLWC